MEIYAVLGDQERCLWLQMIKIGAYVCGVGYPRKMYVGLDG
jgi:hypothetical protein